MTALAPPARRDAVSVGRCVLRVTERRQIAPLEALLRTALREIRLPPGMPPWAVLYLQRLDLGAIDLRLPRGRILAQLRQRIDRLLAAAQCIDHRDAPDAPAVWYGDRGPVLVRLAERAVAGGVLPWYAPQVHPALPSLLIAPATAVPALLAELGDHAEAAVLRRLVAAWRHHPTLREHVPAPPDAASTAAVIAARADDLESAQEWSERIDPPLAAKRQRRAASEAPKPNRASAVAEPAPDDAPEPSTAVPTADGVRATAAASGAADRADPTAAGADAPAVPPMAAEPFAPDAITADAPPAPTALAQRPDGLLTAPTAEAPATSVGTTSPRFPPEETAAPNVDRNDTAGAGLTAQSATLPGFGRLTRLGGLAYAINALRGLGLESVWQDLPPERQQLRWSQVLRGLLAPNAEPEREAWLAWLDELAAMARAGGAVDEAALPIPSAWLPELDPATLVGGFGAACRRVVDRFVQRHAMLDLPRLLHRPALLRWGDRHLDVSFPLDQAELALRISGLDHDPGWCPALGWVLRFHFVPWPDAPEPGPP